MHLPDFLGYMPSVLPFQPGRCYIARMADATRFNSDNDFVNYVLEEFAREVIKQRVRNVQKEKAIASEELLRSYAYEVRKATIEQTAQLLVAFEDRGRYLDMKRHRRLKHVPVEEIKEWIKEKGLEAFTKRPKVRNGKVNPSNPRFLNELAWGISKKINKRKPRRRNLQKGFESLLQDLITELRIGYRDRTAEQIKESLTARINTPDGSTNG